MQLDSELRGDQSFPCFSFQLLTLLSCFLSSFLLQMSFLHVVRDYSCQQWQSDVHPSIVIPAQRRSVASMYKFPEKDCDWPVCPRAHPWTTLKFSSSWVPELVDPWSCHHTLIQADGLCYQKVVVSNLAELSQSTTAVIPKFTGS